MTAMQHCLTQMILDGAFGNIQLGSDLFVAEFVGAL